jgi:hypothetical protein
MVRNHLVFAKKIEILLETRRLKGNTHTVTPYRDETKYEVVTSERQEGNKVKGGTKHWVSLERHRGVCTCQKPQLMGITYSHVLAICAITNINSNQHVVPFFRASELMTTWQSDFFYFGDIETRP